MPLLSVKHILSFSSEDPIHSSANLLNLNPNKTWRCKNAGEQCAHLVLQLEKASQITGIDIGNDHSAFVEILVGRTGSIDNKFEVLLAMSSLMTPMESRNSTTCNRVRMFTTENFSSETRDQKWDQIKIVCTQPFNVHVSYGLAFIKIHGILESKMNGLLEQKTSEANNSQQMIGRFRFREESPDDNTLSAGSLFARRKELMQTGHSSTRKPAAAIREAASTISKATLLTPKTSSSKQSVNTPKHKLNLNHRDKANGESEEKKQKLNRNRDSLFYDAEDMEANDRLDKLLQRDKEKKQKEENKQSEHEQRKQKLNRNHNSLFQEDEEKKIEKVLQRDVQTQQNKQTTSKDIGRSKEDTKTGHTNKTIHLDKCNTNMNRNGILNEKKKIQVTNGALTPDNRTSKGSPSSNITNMNVKKESSKKLVYKPFKDLFKGVVFVLSGFQNPLRSNLRQMALEMGATYQPDWNAKCTHLVCAFSNTPKYQQVLGSGKIVKRSWIEDCHSQRKKFPWRRYSMVSLDASKNESEDEIFDVSLMPSSSNGKNLTPKNGTKSRLNTSSEDSEEEIRRIQKDITNKNKNANVFDMSTEIEEDTENITNEFFKDKTFYLDENVGAVAIMKLKRFITMYGGIIDVMLTSDINYNITQTNKCTINGVQNVQPEWVYECIDMEMLLPTNRYLL